MTDLLARHLVPSPQALDSAVGWETVLLHLGNDTYYGLDPVGTRIWSLLKEGMTPDAILDHLIEEYDAEPATLEADLRRFLADLLDHAILEEPSPHA